MNLDTFHSKGTMVSHNVAVPQGPKIKLFSFMTQQHPNLSLKRINVLSATHCGNKRTPLAMLCSTAEKIHLVLPQLQQAPSEAVWQQVNSAHPLLPVLCPSINNSTQDTPGLVSQRESILCAVPHEKGWGEKLEKEDSLTSCR